MHLPAFDGHASWYASYDEQVILRGQIATVDPPKRAANLLLHMSDIARRVCMSVGNDSIGNVDGVALILRIFRGRLAPDAIDSIFEDMVRFTYFKRAVQNMDTYLLELELI